MREEVDDEYWYSQGYSHGYDHGQQRDAELNSQMREEIDIAKQQAYDDGIVTGRSIADDDLKLLRKKIEKLEQENILLKQKI